MCDLNGYWSNVCGDKIQLFNEDIFISFGNSETILTGSATIVVENGTTRLSFTNNDGIVVAGYVSRDGNQIFFGENNVFYREEMKMERNEPWLDMLGPETNMIQTYFKDGFLAQIEDAFRYF